MRLVDVRFCVVVAILLLGILMGLGGCHPRRGGPTPSPTIFSHGSVSSFPQPAYVCPPGLRTLGPNVQGCEEYENVKDGTVLVQIPSGTFQMGSNEREVEKPVHIVTVPSYFMARVPVTNTQFLRFVSATSYTAKRNWQEFASKWGEQAPVVRVSWDDARAYCAWAGLRLPSETEWEYAARGPQSLIYPWGNSWEDGRCHSSVGGRLESAGGVAPVGSYLSGASPFGCLDMAGNVWQWTSSWLEAYPGSTFSCNAYGHKCRVLRGGCWNGNEPTAFRAAARNGGISGDHSYGFRCARSAP